MTDPKDNSPAVRSKIAEQALQVLRETRAKMDPELLSRMKTLLSPLAKMPPSPQSAAPAPTPSTLKPHTSSQPKGLERENGLFAADKKPQKTSSPGAAASLYGNTQSQADKNIVKKASPLGPEMEPVDRQKIAKIVLKYMELREEKKPGN